MKQVTHNDHKPGGCLLYIIVMILAAMLMASCCREANEFSWQKWEEKHKFEKKKVSYVKYPKQKKQIIIKY